MKSILLLAICCLVFFGEMNAQRNTPRQSWKVFHNTRLLLEATKESPENFRIIARTSFDISGELEIRFKEIDPTSTWKRIIAIADENENTLLVEENISELKISNSELKKLTEGKNQILIYSWSLPKDPAQAALVRVRRFLLCRLDLK